MQPDPLREQQFTLARHLRDPVGNPPPPGIANRRLKVYRELFFNAIESLLANGFPVVRATLGPLDWKDLVRAFYAGHRSRTPLFHEIAGEFVEYLYGRAAAHRTCPYSRMTRGYVEVEIVSS